MINVEVKLVDWHSHRDQLLSVRQKVFVVEQNVPVEEEIDDFDPVATHLLAVDRDGVAIGTARVLPDGHIGRIAVLKEWRGQGIGRALTEAAVEYLKLQQFAEARLNSQVQVIEFYEKLGFVSQGDVFYECEIAHVAMSKKLS
ncbi:GNAT family N-acetyltransferase [Mariniblastus sp.]|nr:GNAT family N-acetyltransferase [Mariniblastus sp.]